MVGFLWIVSKTSEVIRENTSASLSKGIGEEENSHIREVKRMPSQNHNVQDYQLRHKKYAWEMGHISSSRVCLQAITEYTLTYCDLEILFLGATAPSGPGPPHC
jgi:hypothetical protein